MEIKVRQYLRVELMSFPFSLNWNTTRRIPAKAISAALAVITPNIVLEASSILGIYSFRLLGAGSLIIGFQVRFLIQSGLTVLVDTCVYVRASITLDTRQLIMIRQSIFEAFRFTYI